MSKFDVAASSGNVSYLGLSDKRALPHMVAVTKWNRLQNQALLLATTLSGQESSSGGRLKHFTDTLVGLR